MRCPSCEKFVSMETQEPEMENDLEVEADYGDDGTGSGTATCTVRIVRACADCGDELKEASLEMTHDFPLPPKSDAVKAEPADSNPAEHEFEVEEDNIETIEEGGGRYAKSYYGAEVTFTVTCICGCGFSYSGSMDDKIAASAMDELS